MPGGAQRVRRVQREKLQRSEDRWEGSGGPRVAGRLMKDPGPCPTARF